jgi:hypothetical protein
MTGCSPYAVRGRVVGTGELQVLLNNMALFWAWCQGRLGVLIVLCRAAFDSVDIRVLIQGVPKGVNYAVHFMTKRKKFRVRTHSHATRAHG